MSANPPSASATGTPQGAPPSPSANPLAAQYLADPELAVNDALAQMGANPNVRTPFEEYARQYLEGVLPTLFQTVTAGGSVPGQPGQSAAAMDLIPQQLALAEQFFRTGNPAPYAGIQGIAQQRLAQLRGLPSAVLGGMLPSDLENMVGQLQDIGQLGANPALRKSYDFLMGQATANYARQSFGNPTAPDFLNWVLQTNPFGIANNYQAGPYTPPPYTPPAYQTTADQQAAAQAAAAGGGAGYYRGPYPGGPR